MKQFIKHKFYGKLLSFLKYKRHKKIRALSSLSKKKNNLYAGIGYANYNVKKRQWSLRAGAKMDSFVKKNLPTEIDSVRFELAAPSGANSSVLSPFRGGSGGVTSIRERDISSSTPLNFSKKNKKAPGSAHNILTKTGIMEQWVQMGAAAPNACNRSEASVAGAASEASTSANNKYKCKFGLEKKKYKLNSFLFNILCQFTRSRLKYVLGKEFLFRYTTVPYRLSLSRFIGNKVLRSFYKNLNKKSLLSLRKKITIKAKRSRSNSFFINNKYKMGFDQERAGVAAAATKQGTFLFAPTSEARRGQKSNKEMCRNFVLHLENRLDSSLFRLLQSKPLFVTKSYHIQDTRKNIDGSLGGKLGRRLSTHFWRKIKSPWKNYSISQVKQKITHGHVYINGKRVKSLNIKPKFDDKIKIGGFAPNPYWSDFYDCTNQKENSTFSFKGLSPYGDSSATTYALQSKNLNQTFFLRPCNRNDFFDDLIHQYKQTPFLEQILTWKENPDFEVVNDRNISLLCNYIKNIKIKRFTEIFYLTYKSMFLLSSSSFFYKHSFSSLERFNNLKFVFQALSRGSNQSIYLLWPLASLLYIRSWNSDIKRSIIRIANASKSFYQKDKTKFGGSHKNLLSSQKNLKDLLHLKGLQSKLAGTLGLKEQELGSEASQWQSKGTYKSQHILNTVGLVLDHNKNFSWLYTSTYGGNLSKGMRAPIASIRPFASNCYAQIVYGTRKCKWVQLQQQQKSGFYNKVFNKIHFFELELDFFQLAYRHYKSN